MPALRTHSATPSGPISIATPSASSTSAVPTADDAERLPCLHTYTPQPAVMNDASVVTLMEARRSPPVPTRSTTTVSSGRPKGHGTATSTMARARPVTSSAVSPFACSNVRNAPTWAGVASPAKTTRMVASACAVVSASWRESVARTSGQPPNSASLTTGSRSRSVPPQVVVQDAAGDQAELDLRRALDDGELLGVAVPLLRRVVLHVAGC